ncbi:hypothetical protein C7C46_13355 [Streptomyces tateyamensis]|uniref:Uncharacterized protein n=1 Tax=Streptomyces tateyamensis TaxID=565073 RepID=A0A2V4N6K2_9ACTN|nr:hypothetical protein [Streptomyces tateyamensis]PYC79941.1 hypothetical protein C7C46_13355 [Streptomyces tateyamensis]
MTEPTAEREPEADAEAEAGFEESDPVPEPVSVAALWAPDPEPLGVTVEPTGHPEVDAALTRLARLDGVPTIEHPPVYENVQQTLSTVLASLDEESSL